MDRPARKQVTPGPGGWTGFFWRAADPLCVARYRWTRDRQTNVTSNRPHFSTSVTTLSPALSHTCLSGG